MKPKLALNKETLRALKLKSGLRTGFGPLNDTCTTCNPTVCDPGRTSMCFPTVVKA